VSLSQKQKYAKFVADQILRSAAKVSKKNGHGHQRMRDKAKRFQGVINAMTPVSEEWFKAILRKRWVFCGEILHQNHPEGRYNLDFANTKYKVGIEIDDPSHLSSEQRAKDFVRTKILNELGWTIIRVRFGDETGAKRAADLLFRLNYDWIKCYPGKGPYPFRERAHAILAEVFPEVPPAMGTKKHMFMERPGTRKRIEDHGLRNLLST